jgi:hypothetical protein
MPGQSDTTITITAPKVVEESRTKDLSQEEAGRRLSFLANIVDTEGYAIKETNSNLRDDIASEASQAQDIFEVNQNYTPDKSLEQSTANRHAQLVEQMRNAINQNSIYGAAAQPAQQPIQQPAPAPVAPAPAAPVNVAANAATIQPDMEQIREALAPEPEPEPEPEPMPEIPEAPQPEPEETPAPDPALQDLANNPDFSIETIAKQAKRIQEKQSNDNEVYISLH